MYRLHQPDSGPEPLKEILARMFTARGWRRPKDGKAHTDSKSKIITVLLYLNPAPWTPSGGRLRLLNMVPSELSSDLEFLRRVTIDTTGQLPTPEEVKAFLADKSPQKRSAAIDKVLNRSEFVDFWALKWGDLLRINRD